MVIAQKELGRLLNVVLEGRVGVVVGMLGEVRMDQTERDRGTVALVGMQVLLVSRVGG